jgi:16S rRNA (uracil1498-N3)-methyltransferase
VRLHRFYIAPDTVQLAHDFWLHDPTLLHQWYSVLRFQPGQQVVLFDGLTHERLYKIEAITKDEAHLLHMTDMARQIPERNIYLLWSLLKKDKNDWVLQKCTELGVSHFLPLMADRSEKTGFNHERAQKIVTEAAEQCGRSDIPTIREPLHIVKAIEQLADKAELYMCEQDGADGLGAEIKDVGVFIGPEGGWSDAEKALFVEKNIKHLNIHDFTLRAETAAVTAVTLAVSKNN